MRTGCAPPRLGRTVRHILSNTPHLVTHELWLWQTLTANFIHNGFVHLAINTFFLVWLGPPLERFLGSRRFVLFYLGTGVLAYATYDVYASFSAAPGTTAGASGCVLGLVVLYTLCFPKRVIRLYGLFQVPFRWIVLLLVLSDLSSLFWGDGIPWINNVVHLGGAACGAGGWYLLGRRVNLDEWH